MAALDTAAKIVARARVLLQDTISPYRYTDADLVASLSEAMLEVRRLRPDLFLSISVPEFTAVDSTALAIDEQYRVAVLHYVVGDAQLRDEEDTSDARAAAFMQSFRAKLLSAVV